MINREEIKVEEFLKEHVETCLITVFLIEEFFKDMEEADEVIAITYTDLRACLRLFVKQIKEEHEEGLNN